MMLAGAQALGEKSPALRDPAASLLPSVGTIRNVALKVAYGVALKAQEEGLAPALAPEGLQEALVENRWNPASIADSPAKTINKTAEETKYGAKSGGGNPGRNSDRGRRHANLRCRRRLPQWRSGGDSPEQENRMD